MSFDWHRCRPLLRRHLNAGLLLLIVLVLPKLAFCRLIPTNIPRNKLNAADTLYLLMKDKNKIWLNAELESVRINRGIVGLPPNQLRKLPVAPVIMRGNEDTKEVAFTFDDGPHAAYTHDLLQILLQYHIPATMFLVGTQCERYPYLVREEQRDGFTIGNHTYHHFSLTKIPPQYVAAEIKGCGDVIHGITGKTPTLFRPPGGDYTPIVAHMLGKLGYTAVMWTVDPGDFSKPSAAVILARTLAKASNGTIFLFHDGIPQTMEALPLMIEYLRANGYRIVSVQQMLNERAHKEAAYRLLVEHATKGHQPPPMPQAWQPIDSFNARE